MFRDNGLSKIIIGTAVGMAVTSGSAQAQSRGGVSHETKHPAVERVARQDMAVLAKQIARLVNAKEPSFSYSNDNDGHKTSSVTVDIDASIVGATNPGEYVLSYAGPDNAQGVPNPKRVTSVSVQTQEGVSTSTVEEYFQVTDLDFYRTGPPDKSVSFDANYQVGTTTSEFTALTASTNPISNEMFLGPTRLYNAAEEADLLIMQAGGKQPAPIGEEPLAFMPIPGSSSTTLFN